MPEKKYFQEIFLVFKCHVTAGIPFGGALGYFWGGYVPPGTPNWHPILKKYFPKIDTPF